MKIVISCCYSGCSWALSESEFQQISLLALYDPFIISPIFIYLLMTEIKLIYSKRQREMIIDVLSFKDLLFEIRMINLKNIDIKKKVADQCETLQIHFLAFGQSKREGCCYLVSFSITQSKEIGISISYIKVKMKCLPMDAI